MPDIRNQDIKTASEFPCMRTRLSSDLATQ